MAHYTLNEEKYHAREAKEPCRRIRVEFARLQALFATLDQMKTQLGDGSQDAHYALIANKLGITGDTANADAKAVYDEMNSAVNGNGKDAIMQLAAKIG